LGVLSEAYIFQNKSATKKEQRHDRAKGGKKESEAFRKEGWETSTSSSSANIIREGWDSTKQRRQRENRCAAKVVS